MMRSLETQKFLQIQEENKENRDDSRQKKPLIIYMKMVNVRVKNYQRSTHTADCLIS
jgi:hypothetical protein